jgi:hypothetical protein
MASFRRKNETAPSVLRENPAERTRQRARRAIAENLQNVIAVTRKNLEVLAACDLVRMASRAARGSILRKRQPAASQSVIPKVADPRHNKHAR